MDVYDPAGDRLLACGGADCPWTSALSLANPLRWEAVSPPDPLVVPGPRTAHAVVHDMRRDRFLVMGGSHSAADSAMWSFDLRRTSHWRSLSAPAVSSFWYGMEAWPSAAYDSLGDRFLRFDGGEVWSSPGEAPGEWMVLGAYDPQRYWELGQGAGVALDTRRNRLIMSGGWIPYPHGAGYTLMGVWSSAGGRADLEQAR